MTEASASELDERVLGRRWTVRLDAAGRGSAAVRVSCSRPSCAEQRLPSAAVGRAAAVAHLKAHLRAAPGPRAQAYCACRAESCHTHVRPDDRQMRAEPWRCGGAVVLAVVTDREGRWWQALECCSRCAAATPGAKTVTITPAATGPTADAPATADRPSTAPAGDPQFSDRSSSLAYPREVPAPRPAPYSAPPSVREDRAAGHPLRSAARRPARRARRTRQSLPRLPAAPRTRPGAARRPPHAQGARLRHLGRCHRRHAPAAGRPARRAGRRRRPLPAPAAHRPQSGQR